MNKELLKRFLSSLVLISVIIILIIEGGVIFNLFILATLIVIFTIILGRLVIVDTLRSKNQKKFLRDMENFNHNKSELKK